MPERSEGIKSWARSKRKKKVRAASQGRKDRSKAVEEKFEAVA